MARSKLPKQGYSVKAACRHLGIGPHTLRAWESRYGAVAPERTSSGRRIYTGAQLARLATIVSLVNFGHSVSTVAALSDRELARLVANQFPNPRATVEKEDVALDPFFSELEKSLGKFDLHRISSMLDQKRTSLGARLFILKILVKVMRWVGMSVERGNLSIAHEHALSAVMRDQIYQTLRYGSASSSCVKGTKLVLATPEDDLHEFGILMAASLVAHHGMQGHLLGANLPAEALVLAVKAIRGDVVVLGNAPVPENERKVSFENYLRQLHAQLPKNVVLWIGGSGKIPHLRRVLPGREIKVIASLEELDFLISTNSV